MECSDHRDMQIWVHAHVALQDGRLLGMDPQTRRLQLEAVLGLYEEKLISLRRQQAEAKKYMKEEALETDSIRMVKLKADIGIYETCRVGTLELIDELGS